MSKFTSILFYILIIFNLKNSLANDSDATLSSQSSDSQCGGGYGFFPLKPLLDHIAANQDRWNACTTRLDRMERQLEVLEAANAAEEKLVETNYVQIGSRFFHIEKEREVNWFSASNICRQMGGYLASPRSEEELNGIRGNLLQGKNYWLGISDLANEGIFVSQATGNVASFLKWKSGEPSNDKNNENCVELRSVRDFLMNDTPCTLEKNFICEAAD